MTFIPEPAVKKAFVGSREPTQTPPGGEEEALLERLLGDKALFDIRAPQTFGGPSPPTLYRALGAGLLDVVKNGNRTSLTRATMKRILLQGLGPIPAKKP
jgi:hypothetical protein